MSGPILIAAGGTGGHMFPALALGRALIVRGRAVTLITDRRGARYVGEDLPCTVVSAGSPLAGAIAQVKGLVQLAPRPASQSLGALRRAGPWRPRVRRLRLGPGGARRRRHRRVPLLCTSRTPSSAAPTA